LSPEGEEQDILRDIWNANHAGKQENVVAWAAGDLWKSKGKSVWASECMSEHDGLLCFRDHIYVPDLCCHIALQHHDTKVAGHPRCWKTPELISWSYWWQQMSRYIGQYTKTCDICLRTKIQRRCPTGELHPLPTPENCWDIISIDFISELPDTHGHNAIMNVVDSMGKRAHFIPINITITAEKVPEGLERVKQVYKWWSRVRKPCEKPYLSMEVTTESEVADTAGSTATGAPL
jgi:hypothetical protein